MSVTAEGVAAPLVTARARRFVEGTLFVAVWVALGYALRLSADVYLLVGIPLTAAFQLLVRRKPLRAMWVREAPPLRLGTAGWGLAAALAAFPVVLGVQSALAGQWVATAWMAAAAAGAIPAAYAIRHLRRVDAHQGIRYALSATVTGAVIFLVATLPTLLTAAEPLPVPAMLLNALQSLVLYSVVSFVLEEVAFRGVLDAHLAQPGEPRPLLTALFTSALWGLWHLPIMPPGQPLAVTIGQVLIVHCAVGVPLTYAWRRTGNLTYPAAGHALIDAIRNGLLAGL